jgi:hypothetical protein
VRRGALTCWIVLAAVLLLGCDPAPPGPQTPPITLTRTPAGVVLHLPLCTGERAVSIEIAGPYIPSGDPNPPDLWDVANPKQPDAREFVLGDSTQFRAVRTPLAGDLPKDLFISVTTTVSSTLFRWQNRFSLPLITDQPNGGELTSNQPVAAGALAVSCSLHGSTSQGSGRASA